MPTFIGVVFALLSCLFFFQKNDKLFGLVLFSAIFQSSSVISLTEAGVEPYYLVGAVFLLQSIYRRLTGANVTNEFAGKKWMIAFCLIAILSAFILPFVFSGIPVYEQHVGIDDGLFIRPPLEFRNSNLTHSLSLLLGVLIVICAAERSQGGSYATRAYMFTFYFLVSIIAVQFACLVLGIEFPYFLLQSHAGQSLQTVDLGDLSSRLCGTFTESSGAGAVLACFTAGFLARYLRMSRSLIPALMGLAAILLVRSSGAMAVIGATAVLLLVWHPVFRFPFSLNVVQLRRNAILAGIAVAVVGGVALSPLRDSVIEMTLNKRGTDSFVNRLASDAYAVDLFLATKGVGVGMGSNRPSSLITSLLSTVGLIGFLVFLLAYFKLLSNAATAFPELQWAGFAYFLCLATSGPDYDAPWIWVFLALTVRTKFLADNSSALLP
jgi:hypothetical protein